MAGKRFQKYALGGFSGRIRSDLSLDQTRLEGLLKEVRSAKEGVLAKGRHTVVVLPFEVAGETRELAVKAFGAQKGWKDRYDNKRGTKAARSFQAAEFLELHGVLTPAPVAFLERWKGNRLVESYYFSEYLHDLTSVKAEVAAIFREGKTCDYLVSLLEKVGVAMRKMHDAGFLHRDLGSQNMVLTPKVGDQWGEVCFIDLNRGKIQESLGVKERALDFARLRIPSEFIAILSQIYWKGQRPKEFKKEKLKARRRFDLWVASRRWRHPIKSRKKARASRLKGYLGPQDMWLWDRCSAQAAITMDRADRMRYCSKINYLKIAAAVAGSGWQVWREYGRQMAGAFGAKVSMSGRIGMALEPADLDFEKQRFFLNELGAIPVLLRFGHHEGTEQWEKTAGLLNVLHQEGHRIMVAILQDRRAVLDPQSWREFLGFVLERIAGKVEMVELCHVVNRMKWGVHSVSEQARLLEPAVELQKQYPEVNFSGPACIDFEYHYVLGALKGTPDGLDYAALSHHLYVDRRGAPENKQGSFGTVEKAGLLKAIAVQSKRCDSKVIISEVNWPMEGSGVWSPVSSSFLLPGSKVSKVHVSEKEYGCYMLRYLVLTLCSGFVDQVYWWRLVAHGFGLIDERAEGGWRERVGFQMLKVFLRELGTATFVKKLEIGKEVYALRFEREGDSVTMVWCNGRSFTGPWPVGFKKVLDSLGEEIELTEVGESPVYLID